MIQDDRAGPVTYHMLSLMASGTWLGGGRRLLVLWRVSPSTEIAHPGWWIPVPSWRLLSCPSFPSLSVCPMPCALWYFPVPTVGQCLPTRLSCWGCCFLPDPPFPVRRWLSFCSLLSCPSCWSSGRCSFLWFSCYFNSWLRWVSCLTTMTRVCTCLSKALEGGGGLQFSLQKGWW